MKIKARYIKTEHGGIGWKGDKDPSEEQLWLVGILSEWTCGTHHFQGNVSECGRGISLVTSKYGLSTFDFDRLTWLVLVAHKYFVRAEVTGKAPGYVEIMLHKRKPKEEDDRFWEHHPSLDDLCTRAQKMKEVQA